MEQKYSIYDFPELLYNSKILTNRQRCIVLCLFSFLNLRGGGAFTIDILAEKTGIRKDHIYTELKRLTYTKKVDGVTKEFSIIKREGKKISLDIERLREFITSKLGSSNRPEIGLNETQNGSKKDPKQVLERPNIGLTKTQNGSKKSSVAQEPQSPEPPVNNIIRERVLDKNSQIKVLEGDDKPPEEGNNVLDNSKKEINREIATLAENLVQNIIVNEFKLNYKRKFGRYPLIDTRSVKRLTEHLKTSASTKEELQDIVKRLLERIPEFFSLRDKWVMDKGYSFFAFSFRAPDLLNKPVSLQATNTEGVYFSVKGGW